MSRYSILPTQASLSKRIQTLKIRQDIKILTLTVLLKLGKKTNSSMAHNSRENVSKEDGSREAKHTAANTAAFSDTESDTLQC